MLLQVLLPIGYGYLLLLSTNDLVASPTLKIFSIIFNQYNIILE